MFKSIVLIVVVCGFVAFASAKSVPESSEVQQGMKNAFAQGLERFGGSVTNKADDTPVPSPNVQPKKIFSQYTKPLTALGGGRPLLREQYRLHHYTPLAPSVLPKEFHQAGDKMTAAEAAKIIVPSRPLQYTVDIQH